MPRWQSRGLESEDLDSLLDFAPNPSLKIGRHTACVK